MIRLMLRNLVETADLTEVAKNSYKHFHAPGVNYVNLLFSPRLSVKLYVMRPGEAKHQAQLVGRRATLPLLVNPHSHLYDFQTFVVKGCVNHYVFEKKSGDQWHEWEYRSPLRTDVKPGMHHVGQCGLTVVETNTYFAGKSYYLTSEEIHTIAVGNFMTVMALLQYHDQPLPSTQLFTQSAEKPSLDGLYQRFTTDEIQKLLKEALA